MRPTECVMRVLRRALDVLSNPAAECGLTLEPCRVVLAPGLVATWDTCGVAPCGNGRDGQLFANITGMTVTQQGPSARCVIVQWTAELGTVRCAAVMRDDGTPPDAARVEDDARQQALDADEIRDLFICCNDPLLADVDLVSWTPLGPEGGCVGGSWQLSGFLQICDNGGGGGGGE